MQHVTRSMNAAAAGVLSLALVSCAMRPPLPPAPPGDAGDYAWVRQVVPALQGRKVKGYDELKLLADLIPSMGRTGVAQVLMDQTEYVYHWGDFFVDELRIHRSTDKRHAACYGDPKRANLDGGALARLIRNRAAASGPIVGVAQFNMLDLIYSSLEADNLSPIYRGHLFAMLDKPRLGNEINEWNVRDDFGTTFASIYVNRRLGCLGCHNTVFSYTGPDSGWNRTHPVPGNFEQSLFGNPAGVDPNRLHAFFRSAANPAVAVDVEPSDPSLPGAPQLAPWGIADCGEFKTAVPDDPLQVDPYFVRPQSRQATIWGLEALLKDSVDFIEQFGLNRIGNQIVNDRGAFGATLAHNIVDQVWTEVLGYPLTIPITFPRNVEQRDALWNLSESTFLRIHWSLKHLLRRIVTSEYFNRRAPLATTPASPYALPLVFDPWVEADPRFPPEALAGWQPGQTPVPDAAHDVTTHLDRHFNAMTDSVHRYLPRSLLSSVHTALGWRAPRRFPDPSYPSVDLAKAIGQYYTDAEPGFASVDFQGLLKWESEVGECKKDGKVESGGDDWIDRLIAAVPAYDAAHPGQPASLEDLIRTMKSWLLGSAAIQNPAPRGEPVGEAATLRNYFGVSLGTPASSIHTSELQSKLRGLCGVFVRSPQFLLAGIADTDLGPRPRLRVCNGGPCTYQELCEAYRSAIERQNWLLTCRPDAVTLVRPPPPPPPRLTLDDEICPRGRCTLVSIDVNLECLRSGEFCPRQPPACDPRCDRIDCCGGPMPPLNEQGVYVGWAEGGIVTRAEKVRVLPHGKDQLVPLGRETRLDAGDLLVIPGGAHLAIRAPDGTVFATPREGAPAGESWKATFFMVTGESALAVRRDVVPVREPLAADVKKWMEQDGLRSGEAGTIRKPEARSSGAPRTRMPMQDLSGQPPR